MTPQKRPTRKGGNTNYEPRRVSDPAALNALAHPVRMGIIELLSVNGAMTATELAEELDETPANCSWHLRKLADYGFVTETGEGTGRKRPWRMTQIGFQMNGPDAGPEERRAARGLQRVLMQRFADRYAAATEALELTGDRSWTEATTQREEITWLTADELRELNDAIGQVMSRYRDRVADPAKRPEGSRLVELVAWGIPVDMLIGTTSGTNATGSREAGGH